jgi:hypothetical protein
VQKRRHSSRACVQPKGSREEIALKGREGRLKKTRCEQYGFAQVACKECARKPLAQRQAKGRA